MLGPDDAGREGRPAHPGRARSREWTRRARSARAARAPSSGSTTRSSSTRCRRSRSRRRGSRSRCSSPSTSSTATARSSRCPWPWRPRGIPRATRRRRRWPRAKRGPRACTGPSRRCSTSRATRAGDGSSRAPARIRTSARPWRWRRCAASRAPYPGSPEHLIACAKHFAGYGAADGGRDYDPVYLPEGLLRNVYLPPFQAAAKAGVGTFMSAYMELNDVPATANRFLLRDVLRGEWGFKGFVVSDAFGVANLITQGFAADGNGRRPARGGGRARTWTWPATPSGRTSRPRSRRVGSPWRAIDEAVRPILAAKFRMGLFETPFVDESKAAAVLGAPAHREEARLAAQRSMVLLRNEGQTLPLKKDVASIAVIGPARGLEGGYRRLVDGVRPPARGGDDPRRHPGEARGGSEGDARERAPDPARDPVDVRGVRPRAEAARADAGRGRGRVPAGGGHRQGRRGRGHGSRRDRLHERRGGFAGLARPPRPPAGAARGR